MCSDPPAKYYRLATWSTTKRACSWQAQSHIFFLFNHPWDLESRDIPQPK